MGRDGVQKRPYPSFQNSTPLHQTPVPLETPPRWRPGWAQLDLECSRMLKAVGTRTHPMLTTDTTLGVGPLTSRCMMPNLWLYIFEYPPDGGGVPRFPNRGYLRTSLRDANVWLPR